MKSSAPLFQPLHFIPASQQNEILDKKIQAMYAVAHERLVPGSNHWCFHFQVGANNSVNLDMTPSYMVPSTSIPSGSKGNMVLSDLTFVISPATEKAIRLDVAPGKPVRDFVDLLLQHDRHKYEFNGQGQGCRYWCYHQLDLLYQNGLLMNLLQVEEAFLCSGRINNNILLYRVDSMNEPLSLELWFTQPWKCFDLQLI